MTEPTLWNQLLVWPIVNVLIALYKGFEAIRVPGALGFAIIAMTIIIRIILYPFMRAQVKSQKRMAALKPHLDEINKKHKGDRQALQQAQMALYKEHGINPASGCLPLLLQLPILFALYGVFGQFFLNADLTKVIADINSVLYSSALKVSSIDLSFFGFNLATKPSEWQKYGWWLLTIPVITAALQWYQTKIMMDQQNPQAKDKEITKSQEKNKDGKEEKSQEEMAMEMQKQMAIISPLMFGFFAYQFPLGLALYWNVFGVLAIIQQLYLGRNKKVDSAK